jgi:hypothetical protein
MTFTFYPKALLVTAVFVVMFGATLLLATDVRRGIAATGMLGVLAYVLVEVLATVNARSWWRELGRDRGDS